MDDATILHRVTSLVEEEHALRSQLHAGEISQEEERQRLTDLEAELDQCYDLLRQRRARRDADQNPEDSATRPVGEVEGYLQ